jgi:hypothetical protein
LQQDQSLSQPDAYTIPPETVARLGGPAQVRLLLADARPRTRTSERVERPASVRLATIRDEPDLLDLFLEELAENGAHVAPPSIERIMQHIHLGTRGQGGFVPVIDGDGALAAAAIIIPTEWWFSKDVFLQEVSLFVRPEARRTHAAADLLTFQKWLGQEMSDAAGHQIFALAGVTASRHAMGKCRLYRRHMSQVGAFFMSPSVEIEP